jgi:hypothetical protein
MRLPLLGFAIAGCLGLFSEPAAAQVYVQAESVWLQQEQETFLFGSAGWIPLIPPDPVYEPGLRIAAGFETGDASAIELSYLGMHSWSETAEFTRPLAIQSPFSASGYGAENVLTRISRSSEFQNAELDFRCGICPGLFYGETTMALGIRYLSLDEDFRSLVRSQVGEDSHQVRTTNDIFALQAALEQRIPLGRLVLEFIGEAGFGLNSLSGSLAYTESGHGIPPIAIQDDHEYAYVNFVDLRVGISYWFVDGFAVRGGYEGIVINGLALTGDLLDRNRASLNSGQPYTFLIAPYQGSTILHGGWLGIEVRR